MLQALGWVVVGPMVLLCATQWFGYDGDRCTAALQALFPWLMLPAMPVAVASTAGGAWWLAGAASIAVLTLAVLSWPLCRSGRGRGRLDADDPTLTVFCGNLLAYNPTPDDVAATVATAAADADVLVLVEPTPLLTDAIDAAMPAEAFPNRHQVLAHDPSGVALWTRLHVIEGQVTRFEQQAGIDATVTVGLHPVRIIAAHPYPPTLGAPAWQRQMREFTRLAHTSEQPLLIIGDFNAARWHPSFRRLLRAGLCNAHEALGHGWSSSWPANRGLLPPPFVRLDHALCSRSLVPIAVSDMRLPGSDHTGFVVSVALQPVG